MKPGARGAARATVVLFGVALVLFGYRSHWVEEAGTAERDGYVSQAETLLTGELPRDPFRPLLYPLLIAAATPLVGEPFAAARLLSNLAAILLVISAGAFGVRLGGPEAGLWAVLLTAVNPNLWILGQHASTDMLFAALAALLWLCGLLYLEGGRGPEARRRQWWPAIAGGALFALAFFTRTNALFLVPGLLLAWWWSKGRRGVHVLAASAVALLLLLPHFWLRARVFADPFHDENWKNLAWKLYGYPDWSYLERVPFSGLLDLVRSAPLEIVAATGRELARFSIAGSSQLLGTGLHLGMLLVAVWVIGMRDRRRVGYLLVCAGSLVLAVAATFFAWGRLLLVLVPVANGLLAAGLCELGPLLAARLEVARHGRGRLLSPQRLLLVAAVLVLAVKTFGFRLPAYAVRHPEREVAILRELDRRLPAGVALAGTSPFLGRYLSRPYLYLPDAFGPEVASPSLYFAAVESRLRQAGVGYLVAGAVDLRDRPSGLLSGSDRPPAGWLEPRGCEPAVCLWRVVPQTPPPR